MKIKKLLYLLCCSLCFSCSEEQSEHTNPKNQEYKSYEKVNSQELQQQMLNYLNQAPLTRSSSTGSMPGNTYDFETQEIIRPQIQSSNEEMIVIRSKTNSNNIMAFYKKSSNIENCLIIEYQPYTTSIEETTFICRDSNNAPLFKAVIDKTENMCKVIEIYDNIEQVRASGRNWGCNLSIGAAGVLWSTAFGMVTVGVGFAVGIAWCVFQTWICSTATANITTESDVCKDTIIYNAEDTKETAVATIYP